MTAFLVTYRPLAISKRGRDAANVYCIPPFVDSSCRREPDLESPYPSISALCRAHLFAPRLWPGDEVLYLTVRSRFDELIEPHYRAVAHLQVTRRFESHSDAGDWYSSQGYPIPSNCIVDGNPPLPYGKTGSAPGRGATACAAAASLRAWDKRYHQRAQRFGVFLACKPVWLELHCPPRLFAADLENVFGRVPGTRNPPTISSHHIAALLERAQRNGPGPLEVRASIS